MSSDNRYLIIGDLILMNTFWVYDMNPPLPGDSVALVLENADLWNLKRLFKVFCTSTGTIVELHPDDYTLKL